MEGKGEEKQIPNSEEGVTSKWQLSNRARCIGFTRWHVLKLTTEMKCN